MLISIEMSLTILPGLPNHFRKFRKQWVTLTIFMGFFLLGYLSFILVQLANIPLPTELITGVIFLGGAFFVFLVIRLTRQTISDILNKEEQLKHVNQELEHRVEKRTGELQNTMLELDELNTELSQILNTISTGIRVIDKNKTVSRVNKSFCALTGMREEDLIGTKCNTNFADEGCEKSSHCAFKQIEAGKEMVQAELIKNTIGGQQLHCLVTATRFTNNQGVTLGIVEDFQDISQRVAMEQEREQMQTQLLQRSKLESVGQLAAGIAHEINTPIQYIGANINFISESFKEITPIIRTLQDTYTQETDSTGINRPIDTIRAAIQQADWEFLQHEIPPALEQSKDGVNRISSIVRAMKEFSDPGNKEKDPTDLNEIINNTIMVSKNEWKPVAEMKTHLSSTLPMVDCLKEEMGQSILNIIINAAHAIREKQVQTGREDKGTIQITSSSDDACAEIRISDSGIGMADEVKERIFDPFFTTKEVGNGTGQGLAISHDVIARKHKGTITVDSTVGTGSTLTIRLPLVEPTDIKGEQP